MERRLSQRIPVTLDAYFSSGGKTYTGLIENVSREGVEYLMVSSIQATKDFKPEKMIELYFQIPSGQTLNLNCEVKWLLKASQNDKLLTLGMKIIDPPQEYKEFINTLNIVSVN